MIQRAAGRMNRLIEDLLDVTGLESGQFGLERAPVPAAELTAEAAEMARPTLEGRRLELTAEASLPSVDVDWDCMLRVFSNLVGNAREVQPGDRNRRRFRAVGRRRGDLHRERRRAWIPPEHLPRVFDRFYRGKATDRRGSGLGLAICRGIVAAHGGRIWIESEQGRGTSVRFALPVS